MSAGIHLAIDAIGIKHSGGANVLLDMVRAAVSHPEVARVTVYASPRGPRTFDFPEGRAPLEVVERADLEASTAARIAWNIWGFAASARAVGADLWLAMTGICVAGSRRRGVLFIQQSLPFCGEALATMPASGWVRMGVIRALMTISARTCGVVVAQTPTMRRWLMRAFVLPSERFEVCVPSPRALDPPSGEAAPEALEAMMECPSDRRLLYVGNTTPYKNVRVAVEGMPALRARCPGATLFLSWPPDHPLCRREGVVGLGYLGPDALVRAYDLTTLLVQPSLVESGPLTMGEAMSRGAAVLVADRPYARDMCEEAAAYFDPQSPTAFAAEAVALLGDAARRAALITRGHALVERRRQARPYHDLIDRLRARLN